MKLLSFLSRLMDTDHFVPLSYETPSKVLIIITSFFFCGLLVTQFDQDPSLPFGMTHPPLSCDFRSVEREESLVKMNHYFLILSR